MGGWRLWRTEPELGPMPAQLHTPLLVAKPRHFTLLRFFSCREQTPWRQAGSGLVVLKEEGRPSPGTMGKWLVFLPSSFRDSPHQQGPSMCLQCPEWTGHFLYFLSAHSARKVQPRYPQEVASGPLSLCSMTGLTNHLSPTPGSSCWGADRRSHQGWLLRFPDGEF